MTDSGMDDLISRAAAIDAIYNSMRYGEGYKSVCARAICRLPAVDAVPVVHARWIDYKDDHQCSACKEHTIFDAYVWKAIQFEFCPWCGAKMDGERRDNE